MRLGAVCLLGFLAAVVALGGAHGAAGDPPTEYGDGVVRISRLPWLAGMNEVLTNGWGGCYNGTSHCRGHSDAYGTDWGPWGGGTFAIYAATEGEVATCGWDGGWGYRLLIDRMDGNYIDRYAHLPDCPAQTHFEQGDFISEAGNTGCNNPPEPCGIHLHYQKEDANEWSVPFWLSGINNFCDHPITGFCSASFADYRFVSDNAGPGVNTAGNLYAWNKIQTLYTNLGHWFSAYGYCPPNRGAWDCFGSSKDLWGEGYTAGRSCIGTPQQECGWSQEFLQDEWHGFAWPEACDVAYWGPDGFYVGWLNNSWLGYPRTSVYYSFLGPRGEGYYQAFRNGYLYSGMTTETAYAYSGQTTTCG